MPHAKAIPVKHCENCGVLMNRKRINGRLEDYGVFLRRRNCSQACANSRQDVTKGAHHWRARKHRKNECENCGTTNDLHVHHTDRNHANDDPTNLKTLCSSCHLKLHWREDRQKRLVSAAKAAATAARRGVSTQRRSTDGRFCSVE
jgi:hypothetical protein